MAGQTIELAAGESKEVSFEATPHEARVYQVSVDGLTGSFVATAPGLIGDLNDDGIVDTADLDILEKYIVGYSISQISPLTETEFLRRADVNDDGIINILDITALEALIPGIVDYLELTKDELYEYLIDGSVSRDWWKLSETNRRALALKIINWWSVPLGSIYEYGVGGPNCAGVDETTAHRAWCVGNAHIRILLFGQTECPKIEVRTNIPMNAYYKDRYANWKCLCQDRFNLPIHLVGAAIPDEWAHGICALQVGENRNDFNSWIFFQYNNPDIKPGDWQMPAGCKVRITEMYEYHICVTTISGRGNTFAEWYT